MNSYRKVLEAACRVWSVPYQTEPGSPMMEHLTEAAAALPAIRNSYKARSPRTDYRGIPGAAYALGYFAPYRRMAESTLGEIGRHRLFDRSGILRVCVLGSGPGPEVFALWQHVAFRHEAVDEVRFRCVDRRASDWHPWMEAMRTVVCTAGSRPALEVRPFDHEIGTGWPPELLDEAPRYDAVIVQNLLNEVQGDWSGVRAQVIDLVDHLRPGAVVLVADQARHSTSVERVEGLESALAGQVELVRPTAGRNRDWACNDLSLSIPRAMWDARFFGPTMSPRTQIPTIFFAGVKR